VRNTGPIVNPVKQPDKLTGEDVTLTVIIVSSKDKLEVLKDTARVNPPSIAEFR
jgi:hypothetical protein